MDDQQLQILNELTEQIFLTARACAQEQHTPSRDPDAMDDYIKGKKETLDGLRRIRQELEDLWSGVVR